MHTLFLYRKLLECEVCMSGGCKFIEVQGEGIKAMKNIEENENIIYKKIKKLC